MLLDHVVMKSRLVRAGQPANDSGRRINRRAHNRANGASYPAPPTPRPRLAVADGAQWNAAGSRSGDLSNEERAIHVPTAPEMMNDSTVAMLTTGHRSQPRRRQADQK